jgi:alpha/beta superfamily hydrolase
MLKEHPMNIPIETKPALWGAVGGAAVLAIVGFNWGGWVSGSTAEAAAVARVDAAVVSALAPVCVAKFRRDTEAEANLVALKKADSWSQGDFVEKGGWATVADSTATAQVSSVAKACSDLLTKA